MKGYQFMLFGAALLVGVAFLGVDPVAASALGFIGAVVSVKSTVLTNRDATPNLLNKAYLARARVHRAQAIVTTVNGDSIASVYRFVSVKSNDLVSRVEVINAACGAGCTADIGLYDTTLNGAAVVDADFFGSAIDLATAHLAPLDVTLEAAAGPSVAANREKRIWEALGLSADPQKEYDVCATLTAAAAAAGAICIAVEVVPTAG